MWNSYKKGFVMHLQLEKSLSQNTVEAYTLDLDKLIQFTMWNRIEGGPESLTLVHLQSYLQWIAELGMSERSQMRIISGIKSFYRYCLQEQITKTETTITDTRPPSTVTMPDGTKIEI